MNKKVLFLALGAAMSASLFADDDTRTFISGTGFETLSPGNDVFSTTEDFGLGNSRMWRSDVENTTGLAVVTNYDNNGYTRDGAYFPSVYTNVVDSEKLDALFNPNGDNNNYLYIDSSDALVARKIWDGENYAQPIGSDGIYIDTMVKFTAITATDPTPAPGSDDKLLVWLFDNDGVTNLMVTAGYYDGRSEIPVRTDYVVTNENVTVEDGTWYRLTVVAKAKSDGDLRYTGFKVYIDGNKMEAEATSEFDSLVANTTIKEIGFKGQGYVDDIVFGTGSPYHEVVPVVVPPFSVGGTEYASVAALLEGVQTEEGAITEAITIVLNKDYTLDGDLLLNANVTLDLNGFALTVGEETEVLGVLGGTTTITGGGKVEGWAIIVDSDNGGALAVGVDGEGNKVKFARKPVDGSGEEYTPAGKTWVLNEGYYTLEDAGGGATDVDSINGKEFDTPEAAAAAAAAFTPPTAAGLSGDQVTTYKTYVTATASGKVVTVAIADGKEEELQGVVDDAAADALAAADDGVITVPVVPGLYYTLEQGTELPLEAGTPVLATGADETKTFTIQKDAAQGFYRIKISPTAK